MGTLYIVVAIAPLRNVHNGFMLYMYMYVIHTRLLFLFFSAQEAKQYPVLTFSSGPTNSMRGAAFLTRLLNAVVVDIGGTTSDVGVLVNGFPRQASTQCIVSSHRYSNSVR